MPVTPLPELNDQYLAYVESTFIVQMAYPAGDGDRDDVDKLLLLFDRHRSQGALRPVTSQWALIEATGVLYGKLLEEADVAPPTRYGRTVSVRNHVPPVGLTKEMKKAEELVAEAQLRLRDVSDIEPVIFPPSNDPEFWMIVKRLATEAAIWPPDSIHVATAIFEGCSMFITDDTDLQDKIDWCLENLITPIQKNIFAQLDGILPFCAHGLWTTTRNLPRPWPAKRPSAFNALEKMGFAISQR